MTLSKRVIVAGHITDPARLFLVENGCAIEEARGLLFIELPDSAVIEGEQGYPRRHSIFFLDADGEPVKSIRATVRLRIVAAKTYIDTVFDHEHGQVIDGNEGEQL